MKVSNQTGLTYMEILIVVGILLIMTRMASPVYSNLILRMNTDNTTDLVIGAIRKAQNYSMDSKNNTSWGICLTGNSIRIFTGSCASPGISENTTIPSNITVSGLATTTFSKSRGEPSAALSITISSALRTRVITVNSAGGMDIN